jgi:uncharacterized protein YaaW (UPF0174 family)
MEYRTDPDLDFLQRCAANDLDPLVTILTRTKKGRRRLTERLTKQPRFKEHSPDHQKYWDLIAAELQCFGANTYATLARRGRGKPYRKILIRVCEKRKVNFNKKSSTPTIEWCLLMKVLIELFEKTSQKDLQRILNEMNIPIPTDFTPEGVAAAFQAAIRAGKFSPYEIAVIVANAVLKAVIGRGLSVAANAALTRVLGIIAGPIGWVVVGLWTAIDVAGPAYRVTIPAVIYVAYLRLKHNAA